jgi:drug/metabolite transporter (DMT)-like permease
MLVLGVVSTGLGRLVFLWAIATAGSVRASLVTYVLPVSALVLGWAVLGEPITWEMLGGMALVLTGVAAVLSAPNVRPAFLGPRREAKQANGVGTAARSPVTMPR